MSWNTRFHGLSTSSISAKPLKVSTDWYFGGSLHHKECQLSWFLPLRRFMTTQATAFEWKTDTAASFKFSMAYDMGTSSPLYCLLSWLTGYFGWQLRTEASHGFSTTIFLALTSWITSQLLQTNTHNLQDLVDSISNHARMPGLFINTKKTKNMQTGDYQPCTDVLVDQLAGLCV